MGLQQEKKHYHLVVRVGGPASLGPSSSPPFRLSFLPYRLSRGWHRGNLNNWAVFWALHSLHNLLWLFKWKYWSLLCNSASVFFHPTLLKGQEYTF